MSSSGMYIIIHSCRYNNISFDPGWKLNIVVGWPVVSLKETKKQFPPPQGLKGRKEIDEEDRPDLIHTMSIPGGPDNRILEFRPGLARSWRLWRLWSKNVPIYRTERKKEKKKKECCCLSQWQGSPFLVYAEYLVFLKGIPKGLDRYLRAR